METLGGFPSLPALWLRRAKPDSANAIFMETLGGFPNLPAFSLRRAKPGSAIATGQRRDTGQLLTRRARLAKDSCPLRGALVSQTGMPDPPGFEETPRQKTETTLVSAEATARVGSKIGD